MKLYTSRGPNPRVVGIFLAEKGLDLERVQVDLKSAENRREPFLSINPAGQTPALELDTGVVLSEITAICEYLEERYPTPPLIGATAEERALTRMWTRRIDLKIGEPLSGGFRYAEGLAIFESRMRCLPEAAAGLKAIAQDGLAWLEDHFTGPWLAGDRFTLADIVLFAFLEFGSTVGQPLDAKYLRLSEWMGRAQARPSVTASA